MGGYGWGLLVYLVYTVGTDLLVFRYDEDEHSDRLSILRQLGGSDLKMAAIALWILVTVSLGFAVLIDYLDWE